jgi:hypothetical protein
MVLEETALTIKRQKKLVKYSKFSNPEVTLRSGKGRLRFWCYVIPFISIHYDFRSRAAVFMKKNAEKRGI